MTLWLKRAVVSSASWMTVAVIYLFAAFAGDGPAGLEKGEGRRNLIAVCLGVGIVSHLALFHLTRERKDSERVLVDERDREVRRQASHVAFIVTAVAVFLGCIVLDDRFQASGCVPVGWVWFLGYGGWILAYLAEALATVVCYGRADTRGEG